MWCELDGEFGEQMNSLIEKQHSDWRPQSRYFSLLTHFSRLFWCFLGQLCQIDIYGGLQSNGDINNTWNWRHRENFDQRYATRNRNRWWPYMAFSLYSYSAIRLLVNTYYQYLFDFHFLRLQVFKALSTRDNVVDVSPQLRANANSPFMRLITALLASEAGFESIQEAPLNESHAGPGRQQRQVLAATAGAAANGIRVAELSAQLNEHVRQARSSLKAIGAPYINLHYVIQLIYEFLYHSGFVLVVLISVYYSYAKPFNFCLTRAFLDYKHERRLENKHVLDQINQFVVSSRNFTQACVAQIRWHSDERRARALKSISSSPKVQRRERQSNRLELNRFLLDHIASQRRLRQMALNGLLLPVHRTAKWVEQISILTVLLDLLCMFYALLGTLFFAYFFFLLNGAIDIEISPMDALVIAEAGVQVAFIIFIGIFFITQIIANCVDQILFSLNIGRQIRHCIRLNKQKFRIIAELERDWPREHNSSLSDFRCQEELHRMREADSLDHAQSKLDLVEIEQSRRAMEWQRVDLGAPVEYFAAEERPTADRKSMAVPAREGRRSSASRALLIRAYQTQMNSELLKVLMQYKIFVAQLKPLLRSFGTFASAILLLMIVVPLNVRLHSPYLDRATKFYSMSFNVLCTTIVNLCFIPLCYMHSRCLELYICQSSLLAHVVEVVSYSQERLAHQQRHKSERRPTLDRPPHSAATKLEEQTQIYESHSIWLLRKELSHPRQLVGQFAIYAFNVRLTYGNILRLHFWVGLITLSMVVDTSSNHQDFFGRLFSDPMGVFDWQPTSPRDLKP